MIWADAIPGMRPMRQKLRIFAQILLFVSLPAFVLRPVLVTVQSGVQLAKVAPVQKSLDNIQVSLVGTHTILHSVSREDFQSPLLVPCITRMILSSSVCRVVDSGSQVVSRTSRSPLILRI